jgi:hypothetical protein
MRREIFMVVRLRVGRLETEGGTVFELSLVGGGEYKQKLLWYLDFVDGSSPDGILIRDIAGNLYGTAGGGGEGVGVVFKVKP